MMAKYKSQRQSYEPGEFESHWQQAWEDAGIYQAHESSDKPKYYCLDYFPYPSGEGLHVGHCRNYVPTDLISRYKRMQGFNVLHPMGWDAFGEPAEQNAILHGVTPRVTTDRNTANYKRQLRMIGTSYDWTREIDSSKVEYYRWTQSMFLRMYRRGLVYRDTNWQWWCPTCATTLSSHEIEGERCWRGHLGVTKKEIPAWYFRITAYADELISGLDTVNWPEPVKRMQTNWIGRSEGVEVDFQLDLQAVDGSTSRFNEGKTTISAFTTRPDTVYGVTFLALAPEHPAVDELTTASRKDDIQVYIEEAARMKEIDRSAEGRDLTGVFTGRFAINPINQESIPVYIADYVLPTYGTGAVMGVPAHDQRDFEFANKYGLENRSVIDQGGIHESDLLPLSEAYTGTGVLIHSGRFSGLSNEAGGEMIADFLTEAEFGRRNVIYRMRDWLISRQRYWGTPIPIIHCENCGHVPVPELDLPVTLPPMEDFIPDGSGRSPLGRVPNFVNTTCPACEGIAKRETDTMGGFACSSWYFLRFTSPNQDNEAFDPDVMRYWMPVDLYVGGTEHAVLHLLYARFWTKVLADEGVLSFREPFARLVNQGQMHGPDGQRMSKSRGNVVVPDDMVDQYGADALRIHGLFMAPFEQKVEWNTEGMVGARRFLNRVWTLFQAYWIGNQNPETGCQIAEPNRPPDADETRLEKKRHITIKAVTERIESLRFNTMVSTLMEFVNLLTDYSREGKWTTPTYQLCLKTLLTLLAPAAPYIAEELWHQTGHPFSVHQQNWPTWDESMTRELMIEVPVQVDGRRRCVISIDANEGDDSVLQKAIEVPEIHAALRSREITRSVYVPGKILNIVTKEKAPSSAI